MRSTGMRAAQTLLHIQAARWEVEQVELFLSVAARNGWTQAIPPMRNLLGYWQLIMYTDGQAADTFIAKEWAKGLAD